MSLTWYRGVNAISTGHNPAYELSAPGHKNETVIPANKQSVSDAAAVQEPVYEGVN